MSHASSGNIDGRPAANPRAPAEVEVFPLHEEGLVEAAELQMLAPPNEHRGAVRAHRWNDVRRRRDRIEMEAGKELAQQPAARQRRARVNRPVAVPLELLRVSREA